MPRPPLLPLSSLLIFIKRPIMNPHRRIRSPSAADLPKTTFLLKNAPRKLIQETSPHP